MITNLNEAPVITTTMFYDENQGTTFLLQTTDEEHLIPCYSLGTSKDEVNIEALLVRYHY